MILELNNFTNNVEEFLLNLNDNEELLITRHNEVIAMISKLSTQSILIPKMIEKDKTRTFFKDLQGIIKLSLKDKEKSRKKMIAEAILNNRIETQKRNQAE
ncbi:MAG: hypothetical protein R2837_00015 [Aliarcobacter sp.]